MNYLAQVQRGVDYIEANLDFEIALERVSKAAGISHWHFQRIFKALTGETLKTYIRSRRLANSLGLLLTTDTRILDIALRAGFESQESFTRAFEKAFALTPNEYRKLGDRSLFLKKVQFDADYLRHINQNVSLVPEVYTQTPLLLVGLETRFYSVDSEKNNIGDKLPALWERFLPRIPEIENTVAGTCYGVVRQAEPDTDLLEYCAAIEVTDAAKTPADMIRLEVPEATYAKFSHRGAARNIDRTVNFIYSTWLAQSGRRHSYGPDLEIYGTEYHPVAEESTQYYAIPIC